MTIGTIYMICSEVSEQFYIGATINFKNNVRMWRHKQNCTNLNNPKYNYKIYKHIRENGGWKEWNIYPIDMIDFMDRKELLRLETEWIMMLKPRLNSRYPKKMILD